MMLKVGNEYLDFNDLIEMEKQIKLIEEISTTDGDFSYSFELAKTIRNTYLLGNPQPDNISKPVYQRIESSLLSNDGIELYNGYIRIERITTVYECSFFAGNNNWFSAITGNLSDLNLTQYDLDQTETTIRSTRINSDGIVFPLVDAGPLLTRSYADLKIEDMVPGFYAKTLFKRVFSEAGIKLEGELLNDWRFNNMVCLKNSKNKEEIDARSSYVQKSTPQTISGVPVNTVTDFITWDNDSTYPYFDGSSDNFNVAAGRYTADLKMVVNVSATFNMTVAAGGGVIAFVYKNGVQYASLGTGDLGTVTTFGGKNVRVPMEVGDYLEVYIKMFIISGTHIDVTGTLKITPVYLYRVYGTSIAPNWTQQDFVSNVLRMFNCLSSYNANTNTLTVNLFQKIKDKDSIDLSPYIIDTEIDYTEFVSNYARNSKLSYNEVPFDELKEYNFGKFLKYGQGKLEVNNDFIEEETDIVESDFSNSVAYVNAVFDMSIERMNLIELEEGDSYDYTGVTDSSGIARFAIPSDVYEVGDLVRLSDSSNANYNGDWIVETIGSGWVEFRGLGYDTNGTGKIAKLDYVYSNDDDVFVVINIPDYDIYKFSGRSSFYFAGSSVSDIAMGYFDLINTGADINDEFKQSLSFGGLDDSLRYQITMTENYFSLLEEILNDPVKPISTAYLPYHVYRQLDFLSPVTVRTMETTNRYYLNRISGYKESYYPCVLELIKLP